MSSRNRDGIMIYEPSDFEGMRKAGKLAAEVLDMIGEHVVPGVSTAHLDFLCQKYITDHKAIPACVGYKGYAHSTCISVNHVVCHGIPSEKQLVDGDILNIDVTVIVDGYHGDTSRMYYCGTPKVKADLLTKNTFESMWAGIREVKAGATFGDVGAAIMDVAIPAGFSIVEDFCGHGIGKVFHDAPSVLHYGARGQGAKMEVGMFFTIEPMINAGRPDTKVLSDGWTAVTRDKSLTAQFEHTMGVTADGVEIFTLSRNGTDTPF